MAHPYEEARSNLTSLISWADRHAYNGSRNEATTRLHLVDSLIFEILGWAKEDAVSEERYEGRYVDYALGNPSRRVVWEAKKEGIYFELPAGWRSDTASLRTLADSSKEIKAAIEQTIGYCQTRGIPVGVMCNGHQIIALLGSRLDGVPPAEGQALVFPSLQSMHDRFSQLWNALSKSGVSSYHIYRMLKAEPTPPPEKLSQRLLSYPGFRVRTDLQSDLQVLGGLFLEDLARTPETQEEFLRECYMPSGALSQYALVSKEILKTRYSVLFQQETATKAKPAQTKGGVEPELTSDLLASGLSRRPIILLGDVGVGKTMFIRNLVHVEAKELFERAIVLYIDFGSEPAFTDELSTYVMDEFERQLLSEYNIDIQDNGFVRSVYRSELQRFSKSIYADLRELDPAAYFREELAFLQARLGDREIHLRSALEHVTKAQKRQVVVFLDNVDQRPFDFQERTFLVGQSLAEKWPATVFVSLRPDTFFRSQAEGFLAAYQPRVFTISPPRVDSVIDRRIRYAQLQLEKTGRLPNFPEGLTVQSDRLAVYLKVLLYSFETNDELVALIENLSGGNVRRALGFVEAFVGSAHVNTRTILEVTQGNHIYRIPVHEFMRAVIYGDLEYYDPDASPVANVFDISVPDAREHFLLPLLITYIQRTGEAGGQEGFLSAELIYEHAQRRGYTPEQVGAALERGERKQLLEGSPRFIAGGESRYRVTTVGAYHVLRMLRQFAYYDAVVVDTPIVDPVASARIDDARGLRERLRRAEVFRLYLDKSWSSVADAELTFDWHEISQALRGEVQRIARLNDAALW